MDKVPVLFVFFNREKTAIRSFEKIKKYQPRKLYLASDGPRAAKQGEADIVLGLREKIMSMVDWDCDVQTRFLSENKGCGPNVCESISWFFDNEENGVIIEDDVMAGEGFFTFMEAMLEKYKDDHRVGMISSFNPFESYKSEYSYLFSRYFVCWGWASWRDRWKNMDYAMSWRSTPLKESIIKNRGKDVFRWNWQLNYIDHGYVSSWDWQWYFSLSAQNQLCIFPAVNLATNIGNDKDAIHNSNAKNITFEAKELEMPLKHSPYIVPDTTFENLLYKRDSNLRMKMNRRIPRKVKDFKNKILGLVKMK